MYFMGGSNGGACGVGMKQGAIGDLLVEELAEDAALGFLVRHAGTAGGVGIGTTFLLL